MKLGIVVNRLATEKIMYTTTLLAMNASNMGHQVWYIELDKLSYAVDDTVYAQATKASGGNHHTLRAFFNALTRKTALKETITLDTLNVLWLRNDPAEDFIQRPWARLAGINFGRLAMRHGVLVVNDPIGLNEAINKIYLQYFPEEVRPRAIITRNADDIKHFIKQEGGYAVLKPLSGSGGGNVFLIQPDERSNINQIIESVSRDGFIIVQEYLKESKNGDTRLFLLNGKPLCIKNKFAAMQRVHSGEDDIRNNISVGASVRKATVSADMLQLAEIIRPKIMRDGMFLVGLDIVGNKLMEINVFSPGGLVGCERLEQVKFSQQIIHALEYKVDHIEHYNRHFNNAEMATL